MSAQQVTSVISGTVTDSKGSAVPGAQVVVTNTDTNIMHRAQTKDDGFYEVTQLPVGPYRIEVQKEGFEKYVQLGIVLQLNTNPTVNVALQIGSVTQTVEVQANAAMVETQNTSVGQVIQPEQVVDLPLNNRQASQLIALSGASLVNTAGGVTGTLDYPTVVAYSVAGSMDNETNYNLDGSPNMDYRTNVGEPMPFPDALQEFKVETSAVAANVGSRPGGVVGGITKSGANSFHGDLFEFLRNGAMDADSAFQFGNTADTVAKGIPDSLKRNQFGGVIGGPVKKNKVFFFFGAQGTEQRSFASSSKTGLPTAAELQGNFTAYLAPPCQTSQKFLNNSEPSPISGQPAQPLTTATNSNILLPQWLNTPSAKLSASIAALLPAPIDACGDYTAILRTVAREYQYVGRIDWQRTAKDSWFFRYYITDYAQPDTFVPGNLEDNNGPGLADRAQNVAVGDTYSISPTMVNSLRLTFLRSASVRTSVDQIPSLCSLGTEAHCPLTNYLSFDFGAPGFLGYDMENTYGVNDSVLWQLHSHSLTFGVNFQHAQMNGDGVFQVNPGPTVSTGSASYTGYALADFMTGQPDGYAQGGGQTRDGENNPSMFIQDSWKAARRLTVNAGLRWDPFFPQHNGYKMLSDFNLANYQAGVESTVYPNSPPGITYPGDAGFNGHSILQKHLPLFGPRVGAAWDPTGKGKMSVRAGYGLFYSTSIMWNRMHNVLNPPYGTTISFVPAPVNVSNPGDGGGIINPFFSYAGGNPFPWPEPPPSNITFPVNGAYVFQNTNEEPSHTQSWNVSFQYQVTANWLVSATYMGNKGGDQWLGKNINQSLIISAGETMPGIVSTAGMTGTSGPCTLQYGTQTVTFPTCNASGTTTVNGVGNEAARSNLNLLNPKWGPDLAAAPGTATGGALVSYDNGYSSYDGLLVSLQHRFSHGLSILANYTWSHCLDLGEGQGQDIGNSYQNPLNLNAEYGNCSQDIRQILNVPLVVEMPKLGNPWMEKILGGWSTSQIFTASSGAPFSETDGADVSLSAVSSDRPNVVGNPMQAGPVAANPTCVAPSVIGTERAYFNPCAFMLQPAGTFGNEGRNVLYGPGHYNLDSNIWRTFRIREKYKLDVRGEAFNILNHAWWANPSATMSSTSGIITAAGNSPRILQVAMKLTF
jgi:hypothetical protein